MTAKRVFISILSILLTICIIVTTLYFYTYRKRSFAEITNNLNKEVDYIIYVEKNKKLDFEQTSKLLSHLEEIDYSLERGRTSCMVPTILEFYNSQQELLFKLIIHSNNQMWISIDNEITIYEVYGWYYNSYW